LAVARIPVFEVTGLTGFVDDCIRSFTVAVGKYSGGSAAGFVEVCV
jgi:hypothetical protein